MVLKKNLKIVIFSDCKLSNQHRNGYRSPKTSRYLQTFTSRRFFDEDSTYNNMEEDKGNDLSQHYFRTCKRFLEFLEIR
jgi:hypothetical protein